tara:strand:+ start:530 stop:901 length:372 start_codon:yes stop_codon:yes gene_type:complete
MTEVKKVDKRIKSNIDTTIQYQILTYCFFNGIQISNSDLKCLSELAKNNDIEITKFCELATSKNIFKSCQSARNAITKATRKKLVTKVGKNKKTIKINDAINIQTNGIVLLDYKILGRETKEL